MAYYLNLEKRQVDGIFTSAIQRQGLGYREEAKIILQNGTIKTIKLLKLYPKAIDK